MTTVYRDRCQELSSAIPATVGTVVLALSGMATQYNRTFAVAGYTPGDSTTVHLFQTTDPSQWCVVPVTYAAGSVSYAVTDIIDGSAGPAISPAWSGAVTVGIEPVASLLTAGAGNYLATSMRLAEFTTPEARAAARANLELQDIDGGTFN